MFFSFTALIVVNLSHSRRLFAAEQIRDEATLERRGTKEAFNSAEEVCVT